MFKALLALALLLVPGPATPTAAPSGDQPTIALIDCDTSAGSAFRISPHVLISAKHVVVATGCQIKGQPYQLIKMGSLDYAILSDDRPGPYLDVDCTGFVKGHMYQAMGHPRDLDQVIAIPMIATGLMYGHEAVLLGIFEAQPGMSGGPIIDEDTGKVVGIVDEADWEQGLTFSVELKNTSICAKPAS